MPEHRGRCGDRRASTPHATKSLAGRPCWTRWAWGGSRANGTCSRGDHRRARRPPARSGAALGPVQRELHQDRGAARPIPDPGQDPNIAGPGRHHQRCRRARHGPLRDSQSRRRRRRRQASQPRQPVPPLALRGRACVGHAPRRGARRLVGREGHQPRPRREVERGDQSCWNGGQFHAAAVHLPKGHVGTTRQIDVPHEMSLLGEGPNYTGTRISALTGFRSPGPDGAVIRCPPAPTTPRLSRGPPCGRT